MLDTTLIAYEMAAIAAIGEIGVDHLTRRDIGFEPPKTSYYSVDLALLPSEAGGESPLSGQEIAYAIAQPIDISDRHIDASDLAEPITLNAKDTAICLTAAGTDAVCSLHHLRITGGLGVTDPPQADSSPGR